MTVAIHPAAYRQLPFHGSILSDAAQLAVSPDGACVCVVQLVPRELDAYEAKIDVWDGQTMQLLRSFLLHDIAEMDEYAGNDSSDRVRETRFVDDRTIALALDTDELRLIDITTGEQRTEPAESIPDLKWIAPRESVTASNQTPLGLYVLTQGSTWTYRDWKHRILHSVTAPTMDVRKCHLTSDGQRAFVRAFPGDVYVWDPGRTPPRTLRDHGWIVCFEPIGDDELVCITSIADHYELIVVHTQSLAVVRSTRTGIDALSRNAYDVGPDGRLYIGDAHGRLRRFDLDMRARSSATPRRGRLRNVLCDPATRRVAVLSGSHTLSWSFDDKVETLNRCYADGRPIDHGSKRRDLSLAPDGSLYAAHGYHESRVWIDDDNMWLIHWNERLVERHRRAGFDADELIPMTCVGELEPPWEPCGAVGLHRHVLFLTTEGRLVAVDPHSWNVDLAGATVRGAIRDPIGMAKLDGRRVAIWTEHGIRVLGLDADLRIETDDFMATRDVINVKLDPSRDRLVVCHRHHLSFWHETRELFRLYLLDDGSSLVQVPETEGVPAPGYFAQLTPDGGLIEPHDAEAMFWVSGDDGAPIRDRRARKRALSPHFRAALVQAVLKAS